ncbi:MAG TPA: hypothetical protein VM163_09460 [bacterium]|nr:hypothetical protein [bacterium]
MRRSPLVTLLLVVGFAALSVTVWNLSGCTKGGGGGGSGVGPKGATLELTASSSQAEVFRNIELTAILKDAYNMPIADERVVFKLLSKSQTSVGSPLYRGLSSSKSLSSRGTSIVGQQRAVSSQTALPTASADKMSRASRFDSTSVRQSGDPRLSGQSPVSGMPSMFSGRSARLPVPLAEPEVTLDGYEVGSIFADKVTDSMGGASVVVTSETLKNYVISTATPDGVGSNQVSVQFMPNLSYRCSLTLTADSTLVHTGSDNPVIITGKLAYNEEPVVGQTLNFSASTTTGEATEDVVFSPSKVGTTNSSGEVVVQIYSDEMGTYNICLETDYSCPSGSPLDTSSSCKYIDFRKNICNVELTVDPNTVQANGNDEITATAVLTMNSEILKNEPVIFSLDYMKDPGSDWRVYFSETESDSPYLLYTDANGTAVVAIRSYGYTGECAVKAEMKNPCDGESAAGSVDVTFKLNKCGISVVLDKTAVRADGSEVTATATVKVNDKPVGASVEVKFEASLTGVVFTSGEDAYTNESGVATAKFNSPGYSGLCTVTARTTDAYPCPGSTDLIEGSADVMFDSNECELQLTIDPMIAKANASEVSALAVLTVNGQPVPDQSIVFSAHLSGVKFSKSDTSSAKQVTDSFGQALVKFYSDGSTGDCPITAVTESYTCFGTETRPSAEKTMHFESEDYSIALTAQSDDPYSKDGSSAAANGLREIQLRAVLSDKNGLPVGGAEIVFGCENGCLEHYGSPVVTTAQGVATTRMTTSVMLADDTAGPDEEVSIWADYISATGTHRQAISYRFRKIRIASLSATDYSILEDGSEETVLTAKVTCSDGYPVAAVGVEAASHLGLFETGESMIILGTDSQGNASVILRGHCLHGQSTESVRIQQQYCDFGNVSGMEPPVFWTSKHVTFEEGGAGCYSLKFDETVPKEVCFKHLTEDEGGEPYDDRCNGEVWVCLTRLSDGSAVAGKQVRLYIDSFSNAGAIAFFNDDQALQSITVTTDGDGCINAYLDVTGGGRVLLRAQTTGGFGTVTANTSYLFGQQFCVRISPTSGAPKVGDVTTFTARGGCSKTYHWTVADGGVPNSGVTGENEQFTVYWNDEGPCEVKVCDDYDDCVTAYVMVEAKEEPTESPSATGGGGGLTRGGGLRRGFVTPTPTPAPGNK